MTKQVHLIQVLLSKYGGATKMAWGKAGSTTLSTAGDNIDVTVSDNSTMQMMAYTGVTGGHHSQLGRFNSDGGTTYATRKCVDGGTDWTGISQTKAWVSGYVDNFATFSVSYIVNISTEEKLMITHVTRQGASGAQTSPKRTEGVSKWANTSDTISSINLVNGGTGDYDTSSNLTILGSDITPAAAVPFPSDVPEYSRAEITDTRKMYTFIDVPATTFDLPNISFTSSKSIGSQTSVPAGVNFKSDGTKMYVLNGSADFKLYQYSLSTAWDVSTASYDSIYAHITGEDMASISNWKSDGTKFFAPDGYGSYGRVIEYTASTAWDVSTLSATSAMTPGSAQQDPQGIYVKPDGTQMITVNTTYDRVYNYAMSTPWDLSTASFGGNTTDGFYVGTQVSNPTGLIFNSSGTKMFIHSPTDIYQYTLSTAWDVSTASYDSISKSVTGSIKDSQWKTDGSKLYLVNNTGDTIDEYKGGIAGGMQWKEKGTT